MSESRRPNNPPIYQAVIKDCGLNPALNADWWRALEQPVHTTKPKTQPNGGAQ
jgi:hypothetical protein